jgi:hypothetical protein
MEFKMCNYPGTRLNHELPMNISSLKQFVNNWREVINTISQIRNAYLKARAQPKENPVTIIDLWIISRICQILPAYLMRRYHNPVADGEIPVVPAIIHRISLGLHRIGHVHLIKQLALGKEIDIPSLTASELYLLAEQRGLLVGTYSVCAGPRSMIEQSYQAMLKLDVTDINVDNSINDDFLTYSYRHMCLEVEKGIFGVYSASIVNNLIKYLALYATNPTLKPLYQNLISFESHAAENSPLVYEIAREDIQMLTGHDNVEIAKVDQSFGQLRKRMLTGLKRLRHELDIQYKSYKSNVNHVLMNLIIKQQSITISSEIKNKVYGFFSDLGYEGDIFKYIIDSLLEYLYLESISMGIFEILQNDIYQCLNRTSETIHLNAPQDIINAFGPQLRDFMCNSFHIQINNSPDVTTIKHGNQELSFSLLL